MNTEIIKTSVSLLIMIVFLAMAFVTNNIVDSKLFASVGIIIGALAFKQVKSEVGK